MVTCAKILATFLAALTLIGCATAPASRGRADLLNFLADGKTTREETVAALGQPSGRFEGGRILTYRLGYDPKNSGYYTVERETTGYGWPKWAKASYSLVLIFPDAGVLREHALVKVVQ